ncbi:hypothetical protein AB0K80_08190 [Streptomyces sp. NPDC052682]|uniref:hypothetical protein n=1 Tax=Streptomyces sp. NPDC052682 TaxID=3154954 RepID=UPI00343D04C0
MAVTPRPAARLGSAVGQCANAAVAAYHFAAGLVAFRDGDPAGGTAFSALGALRPGCSCCC